MKIFFRPKMSDNLPASGMTAVETSMYRVAIQATMSKDVLKSFTMVTSAGENMYESSIIMKTPSISTTITKYGDEKMLFLFSPEMFSLMLSLFMVFQQTLATDNCSQGSRFA